MSATKTDLGHAKHTQDAQSNGLRGHFHRPIKVTILGAGSHFTLRLVYDICHIPGHQGGEIALIDIDPKRLEQMYQVAEKVIAAAGQTDQWKLVRHTDRTACLTGTDYLINTIDVGGLECVRADNDIPLRYGIDQCIGDTVGPGGLFKALRTIPVWLDILRDAEKLCPQAWVLNYTNPMGMLCLAAFRESPLTVIGLCHSVQASSKLLAFWAGVPLEEMDWQCAGINHLAWFTRVRHDGRDLYPQLRRKWTAEVAGEAKGTPDDCDIIRKDMALHFGAYITESSGHLSEYVPYYRKRKDLLERYTRARYDGESSFYANNWPQWREAHDAERQAVLSGEKPLPEKRSWEYASWIIEAREKDCPHRIHGNVYNRTHTGGELISNLPGDGCVEVACMIDRHGIHPTRYGELPPQMAALCRSNMNMIDLGAQAAVQRSKELATYALLVDPLSATICSPAEIKAMTAELFDAQTDWLADYC